ncbi:MAG: glucose-1-phosphate cytidylyltransferase [Dehalococcoidia bacterium]|nr:glucose-1-phosphate cytidylyltransferase [Dehalococcoidia bacterium]
MKVAILAGGRGTRLAEETDIRPKPMVEIGGKPILWHIMKYYEAYGFDDFVIALGYKGDYIKKWAVDLSALTSDITVDFRDCSVRRHDSAPRGWRVDLIDTGQATQTGGRIRRLAPYVGDTTFMLTWGDGVSNVDLNRLLAFHREHGKIATLTAVQPPARFGHLHLEGERVMDFTEKPESGDGYWINGAFFVLEPEVFDYIDGDDSIFEREPMTRLAHDGQLMAYKHEGFWQCMDTIRDREYLEMLWASEPAWRIWAS